MKYTCFYVYKDLTLSLKIMSRERDELKVILSLLDGENSTQIYQAVQ
jgi:hypothetical protein